MSQQKFGPQPGDKVAEICNNNFDELYAADIAANANIALALNAGIPFKYTVKLTATAAATPVNIVPAALVTGTKKVFPTGILLNVNGGTAWTDVTATLVKIQDTAASPVVGITIPKALLTANKIIDSLAVATLVISDNILQGIGFTAAKGLDIVADAIFAAGSDIYVTVTGYIA